MIDTLQAVRDLQASGVDQKQAEAHVRLFTQFENNQFSNLATKQELKGVETKLSSDIKALDIKLSSDIKALESKMDNFKWTISIVVIAVGLAVSLTNYFHP